MQIPHFGRLAFFAALFLLVPAAPAQDEGTSVRELRVKEILAKCKGASIAQIWRQGDALAKLGNPAKRIIQRSIKDVGIEGQLAGLKALIDLDSPTYAAEKLMDIAVAEKGPDVNHRLAALELIGLTDEEDAEEGLMELLLAFNPRIRIAAARALWQLDSPQSHRAKAVLREFLKSSDPELRAQGVLALAEMGDSATPGVMETLRELTKEPGLRGQLASALYAKLNLQRTIQMREARDDARNARARTKSIWRHLDEIRQRLRQVYDLEEGADDESMRLRAARGLLDIPADPHTQFMTPKEYREFLHGNEGVDPAYGGIGAFIDTNVKDSFRILRPIFGGPAWKADLRGGDDIVAVNGKPTAGRSQTDIIKQIKGPPGTPVILTILREGWSETQDLKVIRDKIVLPTVFSRMLPGKIGYIVVAQFAYETGKELEKHLGQLEAEGMRGLILDVRDNPGGLLGSVKECLTPFLREGDLICTARGRIYRPERHFAGKPDRSRPYPISVLVNGRSASGSELLSGVLQHYSKTSELAGHEDPYLDVTVVGTPTFGKGTMQSTFPLQMWPGEKFTDEPRRNGRWDFGEDFTDKNNNRRWDPGEPFNDEAALNNRWDGAEKWVDQNGNGARDADEEFTDENGDGIWNAAEQYTDANKNNQYDYGAAAKMTIARYYLPGGRNFTRTRVWNKEQGKYDYKGGVEPDRTILPDRMELSHLVELREFQSKGLFRDFVKSRWAKDRNLFQELSLHDGRDPARYPDFEAFYAALNTRLTRQEVRRALRIEVRRAVAVERGQDIYGDLSEDNVLRGAVADVLRRLGIAPESIAEYRFFKDVAAAK